MVYCQRGGESNHENAEYCIKCGQALRGKETGFDRLRYDFNDQSLCLLRLVASVVETAIVALVRLMLTMLLTSPSLHTIFSGQWS